MCDCGSNSSHALSPSSSPYKGDPPQVIIRTTPGSSLNTSLPSVLTECSVWKIQKGQSSSSPTLSGAESCKEEKEQGRRPRSPEKGGVHYKTGLKRPH